MMLISILADDSDFFGQAFFGLSGFDITLSGTPTSTQIVVDQPDTGATTTIIGTGFTFNALGDITGGTITNTSFENNGLLLAQFSDYSWSATQVFAALEAAGGGDETGLETIFNAQPITIDASAATGGFNTTGLGIAFTTPLEFIGSSFKDIFTGGTGKDNLSGNAKNDTIDGGGGNDIIKGGSGNDTLRGGVQGDSSGAGANTISGGSGKDSIVGENGADVLKGGSGYDQISGGGGKDKIFSGSGGDKINGGDGFDIIKGGSGDDSIAGDAGNDKIFGAGRNDVLVGGDGDDRVFGGGGDDVFFGGTGRDRLSAGKGNDFLTGGAGHDIFRFKGDVDQGLNAVTDFKIGSDFIEIAGDFSDISSITGHGAGRPNTIITLTSGTEIILEGVNFNFVGLGEFIFV